MVLAPPRHGYEVVCRGRVIPAPKLEVAARELAAAYRDGCECRVYAACTPNRRRELHSWEAERIVERARAELHAPAPSRPGLLVRV